MNGADLTSHPDRFDKPLMQPEPGPATTNATIPARVTVDVDTYVLRTNLGSNCRTFVAANTAVPVLLEGFPRIPA